VEKMERKKSEREREERAGKAERLIFLLGILPLFPLTATTWDALILFHLHTGGTCVSGFSFLLELLIILKALGVGN
jgi:hypothetical protein